MSRIAIIGAGLGGLSAAAHLKAKNHDVVIFENLLVPGGRASKTVRDTPHGQYLMECGPTVFTMLDTARQPFDALRVPMENHVDFLRVDPAYCAQFGDGSTLQWPGSSQDIFETLSDFAGRDQAIGFQKYCDWLEKLVAIEYEPFIVRNFSHAADLLRTPQPLLKLLSMGAFSNMEKKVRSFISDERLVSMCTFQSLYAGVTPQQALAVYCIISYMDLVQGVYYPKGGMHTYAQGLADACGDAGVKILYDSKVTAVRQNNNGITLSTESGSENFDSVVCNADLPFAYPEIFDKEMPRRVKNARYSPSCLLYVVGGVSTDIQDRSHHTISFSKDTKKSFDDLVRKRRLMSDPSVLISKPTISDPSISPQGTDVYYVLEPSPHLDSQVDFEATNGQNTARMRNHLSNAGIKMERVDCEIFLDPPAWESQGMYRGTPFSLAHTFLQSGPFRAKNTVKSIPGLFLCGTGTTPGVGIPMVIESGKLASMRVDKFLESRKSQ